MTETTKKVVKRVYDPKVAAFIRFFESQGFSFVDEETGNKITVEEDDGV